MFKKILFLIALLLDSEALTPHLFGAQDKTSYEIIQEWDPQTSIHHGPHQAQEWIRKCHDLYPTLFDDPQNDPRYLKLIL